MLDSGMNSVGNELVSFLNIDLRDQNWTSCEFSITVCDAFVVLRLFCLDSHFFHVFKRLCMLAISVAGICLLDSPAVCVHKLDVKTTGYWPAIFM